MPKTIYITPQDRAALFGLLTSRQPAQQDVKGLTDLREELERAVTVHPEDLPPYVVTMNARVRVRDLDTGTTGEYTLVYPGQADFRQGRVSVLAPVGTALLGQQAEDVVEWVVPVGTKRFLIEAVERPDAVGAVPQRVTA